VLCEARDHALPFRNCATEGNHDLDIRQTHLVANTCERRTFQSKPFCITRIVVTRCATESQHWVFFLWFKFRTSDETSVLICFEVARTHNHRLWKERGGNPSDTFAETIDEKLSRILVANTIRNRCNRGCVLQLWIASQRHRVNANVIGDDEFCPRESDTRVGYCCELKGFGWITDSKHDGSTSWWNLTNIDLFELKWDVSFIDMAFRALRTDDRYLSTITQGIRRVPGPNDTR